MTQDNDNSVKRKQLWGDEDDEDDMGFGVTKTIKPRKREFDPYAEKNVILDKATDAQDLADLAAPADKFDKYKRKSEGGATAKSTSCESRVGLGGGEGGGDHSDFNPLGHWR